MSAGRCGKRYGNRYHLVCQLDAGHRGHHARRLPPWRLLSGKWDRAR
jgi:hypothetical protein